jgi:cyanophycin synthetase
MENQSDFFVHKFYSYDGPNYYLDCKAMVFNIRLDQDGPETEFYKDRVLEHFPKFAVDYPDRVINLFTRLVVEVNRMDINLFTEKYNISRDGEEWVIAFQHLDDKIAKEVVYLVSDWFNAMNKNDFDYDFRSKYNELQALFDKTLFGGPTLYSLIEAGVVRKIPVNYLYEENQFQWGYGRKQVRGRSTTFSIDGIKDTEFTMYKDMVGDFLDLCGLPTPQGKNCYDEEEIVEEAVALGFPVVVKPVAGHKGQGVTTGIESEEEVRKAFKRIVVSAAEEGVNFDGALVQKQIYGYDHRILTVGGKYAACLKRIPAFVVGDGKSSIEELINLENDKEVRLDNARSPLCKIKIDDVMNDWLQLKGMTVKTVPSEGEEIVLRRVANISAGGVSVNVTNDIHPENIKMVENIARFFNVTCLGIDVLAKDITRPWQEGDFGIIEINAGPGVFMHLAPAEGGSVDVPGIIMEYLFGKNFDYSRIPIIAGNNISDGLIERIIDSLSELKPDVEVSNLRKAGVYFNKEFFTKNSEHELNCKLLFRNPKADIAIVNHSRDDIFDFGIYHNGMDIAILNRANYAEYILVRDLFPGGLLIEVTEIGEENKTELVVSRDLKEISRVAVECEENIDDMIFSAIEPYLKDLLFKYDEFVK